MAQPITTKPGPKDLLARMGSGLYREAYSKGMSLSAWLERELPSSEYNDGLDAFGRLLRVADIRIRSIPEMGVWASPYSAFEQSAETRALVPEWIAREWRRVQTGRSPSTRSLYTHNEATPGSWERPYADAQEPRWDEQVAPAIPLRAVIAKTSPVQGNAYRAVYLTNSAAEARWVRVVEGGEVPRAKLSTAEHVLDLLKFGRTIEATYEQLMWTPTDTIAFHIARMAVQAEVDKVAKVIDVVVNGDGNASTAATSYNLTTLDTAATAGTLTLKGWLAFKMKFANPYMITAALVQEAVALQMLMLNTGSGNTPLVSVAAPSGLGYFTQINPGLRDNVGLGWTSDAPALKIVGMDTRFAIERVVAIGGNISEVERFVTRQTQALVMTEIEGYAVMDPSASNILDVNA